MRHRAISVTCFAVALVCAACSGADEDDPLDGESDEFADGGKADAFGVSDGTPEACAVLKLANLGDLDLLDDDARLNRRAAQELVDATATAAGFLADLEALDGVKFIGPYAFGQLLDYATSHAAFACGPVDLQLLAFNDFHGNLKPPSGSSGRIQTGPDPNVDRVDAGGAQFMATRIADLAATNPNTLVVAAGDIIGATPLLSALFHDEPAIESMNAMGLDLASVGNHEFDEGIEELWRMQFGGCHPADGCQDGDGFGGAAFEYLAADVEDADTGATVFAPYAIRNVGNARVAFVGMTLEGTPLVTTQEGVRGLVFRDEAETVNALVPELRAQGIEAIVVLLHEGGAVTGLFNECVGMSGALFDVVAAFDPAIDVVIAGHTNAAHVCDVGGRLVTSAASFGRLVTDIDLTIDELTGQVTAARGATVIVTRDLPPDAAQTAIITRYDALSAPLANRVVGRASGDLTKAVMPVIEATMNNLVADAQLEGTRAAGAVAAFMNPGGVRTDLLAATVSGGEQAGEVTFGEIFAVQPFGNNLITFDVTGAQIEAMLEQQWSLLDGIERTNVLAVSEGFTYAFDPARPVGDKVDPASIRIGGEVVVPAQVYRVTANSFLAAGGDGFSVLAQGTNRAAGPVDLEPLEAYIAARSPVAPPALGRITVLAP